MDNIAPEVNREEEEVKKEGVENPEGQKPLDIPAEVELPVEEDEDEVADDEEGVVV